MKNIRLYMPVDAIANHEDFDIWNDEGESGFRVTGEWQYEKDPAVINGQFGTRIAKVKADRNIVNYYLKVGLYSYEFQPRIIFKHYFVEGVAWDIKGSLTSLPIDFMCVFNADKPIKDAHVRKVEFADKGECYELTVYAPDYLYIAVTTLVAMAIKEEWRGLSTGEPEESPGFFSKVKKAVGKKGVVVPEAAPEDDE